MISAQVMRELEGSKLNKKKKLPMEMKAHQGSNQDSQATRSNTIE
jgi:hypothetical protein